MYVYLAIALLAAAMSGVGTWKVQNWRFASQEKARIEAQAVKEKTERKTVDTAAVGHEADKVQIRTVTKTITKEVERVVKEPFYIERDAPACFDDAGLRLLADAAAGRAPAASEPAPAVPRPQPAK